LGLRDVAVLAADRPRDLGEQARAIAADVDGHTDRSLRGLLDIPLDVDDPLPIEDALRHRQTVARVHGEPPAAGDEADDVVAGQRVAALREANEQVLDPADPHALVRLGPGAGRAWPLHRLEEAARAQLVEELMHGGLTVAEPRHEVVHTGIAEVGADALDLIPTEQRRGIEPVLLGFALEHLAPELDRPGALLNLQPLVDLGARAGGLDDLEPVPARVLARGGDDLDDVALAQ